MSVNLIPCEIQVPAMSFILGSRGGSEGTGCCNGPLSCHLTFGVGTKITDSYRDSKG